MSGNEPDLLAVFGAKTVAELDAADALLGEDRSVGRRGEPGSAVLLVKGSPGPEDVAEDAALAGPDGAAAAAALAALGVRAEDALRVCSRAEARTQDEEAAAARLARYVAASDPEVVVALDAIAAKDLGRALGSTLEFGRPREVGGRIAVAVDGLAASLADPARKRRVWRQFKSLKTHLGTD